jgi:hypothetical protein
VQAEHRLFHGDGFFVRFGGGFGGHVLSFG